VIGRDHRVELTAHCTDEYGVSGEWTSDFGESRRGRHHLLVLHPEAAAIAGMRVERTKRDARRLDAEPAREIFARDRGDGNHLLAGERVGNVTKRDVSRREHDAERIPSLFCRVGRGKHHRHLRAGKIGEHLRVAGKTVPARQ